MTSNLANVETIYSLYPKLQKTDVQKIFEWLKTQPHLPQLTELQVILFLYSCIFELELTKTTIENYFSLRTNSDLFRSGDEETVKRILASFFLGFLPNTTPQGCSVLLYKMYDPRIEKFEFVEIVRVFIMVICLYVHQHGPSEGLIVLSDVEGLSFSHLFKMNISAMRQTFVFLQEAAPIKLKQIHFVNVVPVTKHLIRLIKPFLKKEVYDAIKIHPTSIESLYEHIPKDCLPEEYGGELENTVQLNEKNLKNLLDNLEFFKWHDSQLVDEAARAAKGGFFGSIQSFFGRS